MNRFVTLIDNSLVIRKSVETCLSHNEREQQGLEREALARQMERQAQREECHELQETGRLR